MKRIFIIILFLSNYSIAQDLVYAPLQDFYTQQSIFNTPAITDGIFPLRFEQISSDSTFHSQISQQKQREKWLGRKSFNEHFIQIKTPDFYLAINPLLNLNGGLTINDSATRIYENTRGLEIKGQISDRLSFYSSFHENQAVFAPYLSNLYNSRGEQYIVGSNYVIDNAFVPGAARTKPFKTNGYDYAFSTTYIHLNLTEFLNLSFGNAPHFIGYGKRSFMLSDYSSNRTSLKLNIKFSENFSYRLENGQLLNLFRRQFATTVERPYEKKGFSNRYFTFTTTCKKLAISLFEGSIWFREDSIQSKSVNGKFYNPILLTNTLLDKFENNDAKHLIGINTGYKLNEKHFVYTQFVTDDINSFEYGVQIGYRGNRKIRSGRLDYQLEINTSSENLYRANNKRLSYTHNNYPLAYTFGNNTTELFLNLNYEIKGWFINIANTSYHNSGLIDSHANLMFDKSYPFHQFTPITKDWTHFSSGKIGYRFNSKNNLLIYGKVAKRASQNNQATFFELGINTNLINQFRDY